MKRVLAGTLLAVSAHATSAPDPVVAMRGRDQVTASEARALLASLDAATRAKLARDPAALNTALRDALLRRAILAEAAAQRWDARPDVAALLARAREQVVLQSFLAAQANVPASYPSEAEIAAAYEANKGRFALPRQYHLEQIFIPVAAGATPDDARRRLAALRPALVSGRTRFEPNPQSGAQYADLGWVSDAQLVPEVKGAVAGLPEGQISDPVCTASGCHLLKLLATRPAGPAPLAAVRDTIVTALRQQKQAAGERAYADALLAKTPVQVNEIELSRLVAGAPK